MPFLNSFDFVAHLRVSLYVIDLCRKQIAKKYEIGQIFLLLLTGKLQFYASHINFCKAEKISRHFVNNISMNSKLETREKVISVNRIMVKNI